MWNSLTFGQPSWWLALSVIGIALAGLIGWSYWRTPLSLPQKLAAAGLKLLAVFLVLLSLLEPMVVRQRPKPQANLLGIAVDDSRSMRAVFGSVADTPEAASAPSSMLSAGWQARLSSEAAWQQKLSEQFRLRRYRFGERLESVDDLATLTLSQDQTSLERLPSRLAERLQGLPLAGLVLVTDGQSTEKLESLDQPSLRAWESLGVPVYPVDVGASQVQRDLRIADVTVRQSDFETAPVTVLATVTHHALRGRQATVALYDSEGKIVQSQPLRLQGEDVVQTVEMRFRPEKPGVQLFQLRTFLADEAERPQPTGGGAKPSIEWTLENNQRSLIVDRGRGPYRVLYLAGRPNWEHKFLQRSLAEDAEIELVSLIRIANKEPKFTFRDDQVGSSNPLFAGFEDVSEEEKEQYHEPVFARLGVSDGEQLRQGFPHTAEELFSYHALVIDDIEENFFSSDQQSLLREFVSLRGGGLLYLGGTESMRGKGFRESILAQMLPIYGEDRTRAGTQGVGASQAPRFRYELTREGWLQPFLRTADTEAAEQARLTAMPALRVLNEAGGIKPGAVVLSQAGLEGDQRQPALVTQRFGKGRTAAFLVGDLWRWGLHHADSTPAPLYQAWRQMIRWLVSEVPQPVSMRVTPALASPAAVAATVMVEVKSVTFEPKEDVEVEIAIRQPSGSIVKAKAEASAERPGLYEFPLVTTEEGGYLATAMVTNADGSPLGSCHAGWSHEPRATELRHLGTERRLLEEIAQKTGGQVLLEDDLDQLSGRLTARPVPVVETELWPVWHQGWILALALACLGGEWWIRRRNGLR
jgi:uncharacterized membrane protein